MTAAGAFVCPGARFIKGALGRTVPIRKTNLIDVHHHFVPSFYVSEFRDQIAAVAGRRIHPAYLSWTPEQMIAAMDKNRVATAVLSLTTPGVWFGNARAAAQTARRVNEYAAELVRSHPGRFGLFGDTTAGCREQLARDRVRVRDPQSRRDRHHE